MKAEPFLDAIWRRSYSPPDQRPIWQWAAEEVTLPSAYAMPGGFEPDRVPFVKPVLEALRNSRVREVVVKAGVQCLKTLIGEFWLLWSIVENPGPTQWLQPTDEESKEHCQERFNPLIDSCPLVKRLFTGNRHDKTTAAIIFKHMWLRMEGAQNLGNLQRKSVKNQMRSEIWQADKWKPGHLREATMRMTQFTHNSKAYTESQAGLVGDDMDQAYDAGSRNIWAVKCQSCGHHQPLVWSAIREDGSRAGFRWDDTPRTRRANGEWRWGELEKTVRYSCLKCGFDMPDDARIRRRMNSEGRFLSRNPNAPPQIESFAWNQFAMENLPWFGHVKTFLEACDQADKGNEVPRREFFQKRAAESYDPNKFATFKRLPTVELVSDPAKSLLPDEAYRFGLFDVQEDHFWGLVQGWNRAGDSLNYWFGKLMTWEEVYATQLQWGIKDRLMFVDARFHTREVYEQCVLHGHAENNEWHCWNAFKGDDRQSFIYIPRVGLDAGKKFLLPYSWPPSRGDPLLGVEITTGQGRYCPVIWWSNPAIKDIAAHRRDGRATKIKSLTASTVGEDFHKQMYSERRIRVFNSLGHEEWKWERIGKRDNHGWDCNCMGIVAACIAEIIGQARETKPELPPEQPFPYVDGKLVPN